MHCKLKTNLIWSGGVVSWRSDRLLFFLKINLANFDVILVTILFGCPSVISLSDDIIIYCTVYLLSDTLYYAR